MRIRKTLREFKAGCQRLANNLLDYTLSDLMDLTIQAIFLLFVIACIVYIFICPLELTIMFLVWLRAIL